MKGQSTGLNDSFRMLRPYQWAKNGLVWIPLFTSLAWNDRSAIWRVILAMIALSMCASSSYIINDLLDVVADRNHPEKRYRPIAAGRVRPVLAILVAALLAGSGLWIGALALTGLGMACLSGYLVVSIVYSMAIKRRLLLDVFVLAGLYVVRIVIGGEASFTPVSLWLLAMAWFFFLGLAFIKRYTELLLAQKNGDAGARSYRVEDLPTILVAGMASGFLACLVFCLYVANSATTTHGFSHPYILWLIAPLLLYWTMRIWLIAGRGSLDHDPVWFALKDRVSWMVLIAMISLAALATI